MQAIYFIYYFIIHVIVAIVVCSIISIISPTLSTICIFIGLFISFFTANASAKGKINTSKKRVNISTSIEEISGYIYDDDDDDDGDDDDGDDDDNRHDKDTVLVSPSNSITILGMKINGALIYTNTTGIKSRFPHVIPQELKAMPSSDVKISLDYWSSYSEMSVGNRYDFLKWLSSGREDLDIDIGLLFVYFYGLEWRIIKDKKDYKWIAEETLRLLSIYENNSFQNYANNLLTYISFEGVKKLNTKTVKRIKEIAKSSKSYGVMAQSGLIFILEGVDKVTSKILLLQIPIFDCSNRSMIPEKVGGIFYEHLNFLLKDNIDAYCKESSILNRNVRYYASSHVIEDRILKGKYVHVPIETQEKLGKKWNQAIEDLRKYSNRIGKDSNEKLFTLLPDNLKKNMSHPLQKILEKILDHKNEQVLKFGELAEKCRVPYKEKYSLKDCSSISNILNDNQLSIEPDPEYFRKSFKYDDNVCIFKGRLPLLKGADYSTVSILIDLGVSLAHVDGVYNETEAQTIEKVILKRFCPNDINLKTRVSKRLQIYKDSPPRIVGLVKKLSERLNVDELIDLGNFLFEIAHADGDYDENEKAFIKKTFKGLGIEESYKKIENSFRVKRKSSSKQENELSSKMNDGIFKNLDEETKSIQDSLSQIFKEEKSMEIFESAPQDKSFDLNLNEKKFLHELLEFSKIKKDHLQKMAKEHDLILEKIIDKINRWAEEMYGDYLIFDEDDFIIKQSLVSRKKDSA